MRSPHFVSVAVRKLDQKILLQSYPYSSLGERLAIFKKPLWRGVLMLVESMMQGVDALSFSASVAALGDEEKAGGDPGLSQFEIFGTVLVSFFFGISLFVVVPHGITVFITSFGVESVTSQSPIFHLLDGFVKLLILTTYIHFISKMKEIYRVFQYHGAEHKAIYTFEANQELTVENARKFSTLHPRCGTSFLLFLVVMSVITFSFVFPVLNVARFSSNPVYRHLWMILAKVVLMFPIAGMAYEVIRVCAYQMNRPGFSFLMRPGLALQKLTTREPTDEQLEVALASLKQVLFLEKQREQGTPERTEFEVRGLSDLRWVPTQVSEFLEN